MTHAPAASVAFVEFRSQKHDHQRNLGWSSNPTFHIEARIIRQWHPTHLLAEFEAVEEALADFLPALFGKGAKCDTKRQLSCLPVKRTGLVLPNPLTSAEAN